MIHIPKLKRTKHQEADLQGACERMLEIYGLQYIRLPDCIMGYLSKPSTPPPIRAAVGNYLKGQPDLVVLDRGYALLVELKSDTGRLRDSQKAWAKGNTLHVIRDIDTFQTLLLSWQESIDIKENGA
jgi:hypothetical protein